MAVLLVEVGSPLTDPTGAIPGLLGPVRIRELAEELGVRPTKTLGQNFVHDANTVRRIVAEAAVTGDDHVLEVGPGLGSLTLALLGAAGRVTAVEIDPVLAGALPRTVGELAPAQASSLRVIRADALDVTADDLGDVGVLVANLPYNVAVPVLLHLMSQCPNIRTALVMVQLEVAERLAAGPGSKTYGVPSVKARFFGDVRRAGTVGAGVFWPVPKVESGLVRIDRRPMPWPSDDATRRVVWEVIDAAFAQRRKTLRAALATWAGSPAAAEERLRAAGIDPTLRGERLDVADFVRLALTNVG